MRNKLAMAIALALVATGAYAEQHAKPSESEGAAGATTDATGQQQPLAFDDVDKDGDGYISEEEAKQHGQLKKDQMAEADENQDQRLDESEFSAIQAYQNNPQGGKAH